MKRVIVSLCLALVAVTILGACASEACAQQCNVNANANAQSSAAALQQQALLANLFSQSLNNTQAARSATASANAGAAVQQQAINPATLQAALRALAAAQPVPSGAAATASINTPLPNQSLAALLGALNTPNNTLATSVGCSGGSCSRSRAVSRVGAVLRLPVRPAVQRSRAVSVVRT